MKKCFYIICVVYNKELRTVPVIKSYIESAGKNSYEDIGLIVVDNSTDDDIANKNRGLFEINKSDDFMLISDGKNYGLSKAYNLALEFIYENVGEADFWVMLADDDTDIGVGYIENVYRHTRITKDYFVCGIVRHNHGYMSPKKKYRLLERKDDFIIESGEYRDLYCINSGLAVSRRVFDKVGIFDEALFMDMVDYWMMDTAKKNKINLVSVIEDELFQDFSGTDYSDRKKVMRRYCVYKKDFIRYCKLTGKSMFFMAVMLLKRRMRIYISTVFR